MDKYLPLIESLKRKGIVKFLKTLIKKLKIALHQVHLNSFFTPKSLHVCLSEPFEATWGQKSIKWLIKHKFPHQARLVEIKFKTQVTRGVQNIQICVRTPCKTLWPVTIFSRELYNDITSDWSAIGFEKQCQNFVVVSYARTLELRATYVNGLRKIKL